MEGRPPSGSPSSSTCDSYSEYFIPFVPSTEFVENVAQDDFDFDFYCEAIKLRRMYMDNNLFPPLLDDAPKHIQDDFTRLAPGKERFLPKALSDWAHSGPFLGASQQEFASSLLALPANLYKLQHHPEEDIQLEKYIHHLLPAYSQLRAFLSPSVPAGVKLELGEADKRAGVDGLMWGFGADREPRSAEEMRDCGVVFRRERPIRLPKLLRPLDSLFSSSTGTDSLPCTLPNPAAHTVQSMLFLRPSAADLSALHIRLARQHVPLAAQRELYWQARPGPEDQTAYITLLMCTKEYRPGPAPGVWGAGRSRALPRGIGFSMATNQRQRRALGLPGSVQYGLACNDEVTCVIASDLDESTEEITLWKVAMWANESLEDLLRLCYFMDSIRRRGPEEAERLARGLKDLKGVEERCWRAGNTRDGGVWVRTRARNGGPKGERLGERKRKRKRPRMGDRGPQEGESYLDQEGQEAVEAWLEEVRTRP